MKRKSWMQLVLATVAILAMAGAWAADPSLHEVYQAVENGRLTEAQAMMAQVLKDHPNSAKAHYVEAEILAKEGQVDKARDELAFAERAAPGLPFAKPEAVTALKQHLATGGRQVQRPVAASVAPALAPAHQSGSQFPWSLLFMALILGGAIWFFVRAMNRPRQLPPAGYPAANAYGGNPQPFGGGGMAGAATPGGGMGSGILGGLATGAAVGAGMVAGEALMHRVMGGSGDQSANHSSGQSTDSSPLGNPLAAPDSFDAGGNDFGISDGGSWDDSSSGGGDDWG